jgi:hypothetical protein
MEAKLGERWKQGLLKDGNGAQGTMEARFWHWSDMAPWSMETMLGE